MRYCATPRCGFTVMELIKQLYSLSSFSWTCRVHLKIQLINKCKLKQPDNSTLWVCACHYVSLNVLPVCSYLLIIYLALLLDTLFQVILYCLDVIHSVTCSFQPELGLRKMTGMFTSQEQDKRPMLQKKSWAYVGSMENWLIL